MLACRPPYLAMPETSRALHKSVEGQPLPPEATDALKAAFTTMIL